MPLCTPRWHVAVGIIQSSSPIAQPQARYMASCQRQRNNQLPFHRRDQLVYSLPRAVLPSEFPISPTPSNFALLCQKITALGFLITMHDTSDLAIACGVGESQNKNPGGCLCEVAFSVSSAVFPAQITFENTHRLTRLRFSRHMLRTRVFPSLRRPLQTRKHRKSLDHTLRWIRPTAWIRRELNQGRSSLCWMI